MVEDIEKLLTEGNFEFQKQLVRNPEINSFEKQIPKYPILFLTCMDPRLDIHRIFHFKPGDVFVLRNAGNIYTLDMMRSILITIFKYKIKFIIVLGHFDCGMTKINLKELRDKLPNEFLKSLSIKYSELLLELKNFFKPFDNEIRNIIMQINKLQKIKTFIPDIEITGMIYDTRTGWIFKSDDFKDLLIDKNHFKIYKGLLYEKVERFSKFLEEDNSIYQKSKELDDEIQVDDLMELEEKNIGPIENDKLQKSIDIDYARFQIRIPKIQGPKIYIPKVNIYKPKIKETVKSGKKNL
ncbi:MAG: carbonic anhydrase [Candidatus Hodarchaeota archaeon]